MKYLLVLLVTYSQFICHAGITSCYDHSCKLSCYSAGIEYLYMKPSIYDPFFLVQGSIENPDLPKGQRFANFLPYTSGVRIKGKYHFSCTNLDLFAEGIYLRDREKRNILTSTSNTPPLSQATKGHPILNINSDREANSTLYYHFYSAKGGLQYYFFPSCPFLFAGQLDIHFVHLQLKEEIFYQSTGNFDLYDSKMLSWGVGPEAGGIVTYQIFPSLSAMVRGSYALLVGRAASTTESTEILNIGAVVRDISTNNDKTTIIIPASEFKLGFIYNLLFAFFCADIEIGYDIINYAGILDRIRWIGETDLGGSGSEGLSIDQFIPFMVHGLYVSLSIGF